MDIVFSLIFLISIPVLIIGLIAPSLYSQILKREFSRKRIGLSVGAVLVGSFALFVMTAEPSPQTENTAVQLEHTQEKPVEQNNLDSDDLDLQESITQETEQIVQPQPEQLPENQEQQPVALPAVEPASKPTNTQQQPTTPKTETPKPTQATVQNPNPAPKPSAAPSATTGVVKKSISGGICHAPGTTYYDRTTNYISYNSVQACLNSGGRLPLK